MGAVFLTEKLALSKMTGMAVSILGVAFLVRPWHCCAVFWLALS